MHVGGQLSSFIIEGFARVLKLDSRPRAGPLQKKICNYRLFDNQVNYGFVLTVGQIVGLSILGCGELFFGLPVSLLCLTSMASPLAFS